MNMSLSNDDPFLGSLGPRRWLPLPPVDKRYDDCPEVSLSFLVFIDTASHCTMETGGDKKNKTDIRYEIKGPMVLQPMLEQLMHERESLKLNYAIDITWQVKGENRQSQYEILTLRKYELQEVCDQYLPGFGILGDLEFRTTDPLPKGGITVEVMAPLVADAIKSRETQLKKIAASHKALLEAYASLKL